MEREGELALVARLRAGDEAAFDAIYDAFNPRLFTFLLRLSRQRDVADDLLEETWLRLVKNAGRLRADTRLLPWLFTVARNLHISYVRSRVLEDSVGPGMTLWPVSVEYASPFEAAAASQLERRLERALAALPRPAREVLLLVGVAELSHADAAEVCGITPEALRQRLSRARAALARVLDQDDGRRAPVLGEVLP
jgi:RNA polymerase sigma-70 factor (ECF subfamily)